VIRISSFSYHTYGYPADDSGHGGGFIFDCRCLPNPGRLEEYRSLTGCDAAVALYLAQAPGVTEFLSSVETLITMAVAAYAGRDFTNLSVAFGCTGGQHRSVYCSEWLAERLRGQGMRVTVTHLSRPNPNGAVSPAPGE